MDVEPKNGTIELASSGNLPREIGRVLAHQVVVLVIPNHWRKLSEISIGNMWACTLLCKRDSLPLNRSVV